MKKQLNNKKILIKSNRKTTALYNRYFNAIKTTPSAVTNSVRHLTEKDVEAIVNKGQQETVKTLAVMSSIIEKVASTQGLGPIKSGNRFTGALKKHPFIGTSVLLQVSFACWLFYKQKVSNYITTETVPGLNEKFGGWGNLWTIITFISNNLWVLFIPALLLTIVYVYIKESTDFLSKGFGYVFIALVQSFCLPAFSTVAKFYGTKNEQLSTWLGVKINRNIPEDVRYDLVRNYSLNNLKASLPKNLADECRSKVPELMAKFDGGMDEGMLTLKNYIKDLNSRCDEFDFKDQQEKLAHLNQQVLELKSLIAQQQIVATEMPKGWAGWVKDHSYFDYSNSTHRYVLYGVVALAVTGFIGYQLHSIYFSNNVFVGLSGVVVSTNQTLGAVQQSVIDVSAAVSTVEQMAQGTADMLTLTQIDVTAANQAISNLTTLVANVTNAVAQVATKVDSAGPIFASHNASIRDLSAALTALYNQIQRTHR
jgi:hypothetical protein